MVAEAGLLDPPGPAQVKENVVGAVNAPVLWLPAVDFVPLHPPEAAQEPAFDEVQVNKAEPPGVVAPTLAVSATVGTILTVVLA